MALTRYTVHLSASGDWSEEPPTEPGLYLFRCGENNDQPEVAAITESAKGLIVHDEGLLHTHLPHFHHGLTAVKWLRIAP